MSLLTVLTLDGARGPIALVGVAVPPPPLPPPPPPPGPTNTARPSISGQGLQGSTLTGSDGAWTGSPTFARQWARDGIAIPGATAATYALTSADVGASLAFTVTATQSGLSASATSLPFGPIAASGGGSPPTEPAAEGITLRDGSTLADRNGNTYQMRA